MGNDGDTNSACVAARESREIDLNNAINSIDEAIDHAETLSRRILGERCDTICGQAKEPAPPINPISLAMIMNDGAGNIRQKVSRLHDLLNEIEQTLF